MDFRTHAALGTGHARSAVMCSQFKDPEFSPLTADAAVRAMWEESGLWVRLTRLIGVFGGPEFVVRYRNGHRTSYVATVFEAALIEGSMRPDGAFLSDPVAHHAASPGCRTARQQRRGCGG